MGEGLNNNEQPVSISFSLDRHNFEEYLTQQNSYQRGAKRFAEMFNQIPPPLFLNLQHEAGMAEMFRVKGELLKYSTHLYRQLEIIFNAAFGSDNSDQFAYDIEKLKKIKNYIKWNDFSTITYKLSSNVNNLESRSSTGDVLKYRKGEFICKISEKYWPPKNNIIRYWPNKRNPYTLKYTPQLISISTEKKIPFFQNNVISKLDEIISGKEAKLEFSQREFLFKTVFYFEGNKNDLKPIAIDINSEQKVYLNACLAIKYFRNLCSHNNFDNQTLLQKFEKTRIDNSEKKYLENPESIMQSNYFQQYLDMVFRCYIQNLKVSVL